MTDQAPKSAYEIAMERLRKKDAEDGVEQKPPSDTQKAAIAEARSVYEARLAEREVMHRSALGRVAEPEAREALEADYRRERERIMADRDAKIEAIRRGEGP